MHQGLSCSKEKVSIRDASRGCTPSSSTTVSFSCGKPPTTMDLHVMTCTFYEINEFDSIINLNLSNSNATVQFYIFTG
jgi:hypothetical protein